MKEKILKATAKILSKKGLDGVSTRAVCSEVGITAPTLYHYFLNKDDLLSAVAEASFRKTQNQKLVDLPDEPRAAISQIWDNYLHFAFSDPEYYSVVLTALSRNEVHPVGKACYEQTLELFQRAEQKELLNYPAQEAAFMYQSAAIGAASLSLLSESKESIRILSENLKNVMLEGLFRT